MKSRNRLSYAAVALVLLFCALPFSVFRWAATMDTAYPRADATIVIPSGATGHEISSLLATSGVIRSALVFDLLARIRGERTAMKAGEFVFPAHRTESDVLKQVVAGGRQVAVWVTIPEGFTAKEIAQLLAERNLGDVAQLQTAFLDASLTLGGTRTPTLEGYLFPETYLVPVAAKPPEIAKLFTDEFHQVLPRDAAVLAKHLGYTIPQIVTIASLVEREAKIDSERPLMAGVYYNRLRLGMPLQVDATLEYTFAHHKDVITFSDLARDTPYNTYKHPGLPPTPIANPGRASLDAAFHPRSSPYLYYVYMGNGHSAFSRTLSEHNANVARYLH